MSRSGRSLHLVLRAEPLEGRRLDGDRFQLKAHRYRRGMTRCSAAARQLLDQPLGTARTGPHLFVSVPLPWPAEITQARGFPVGLQAPEGTRVLGYVPEGGTPEHDATQTRMIVYQPGTPERPGFVRREWVVPGGAAAALFLSTASDPGDPSGQASSSTMSRTVSSTVSSTEALGSPSPRELFVCGHGARDSCCAATGIPAYRLLREIAQSSARAGREPLVVRRTSHTGGHRFAPTLVDFPSGRYWGWLSEDDLHALVARDPAALPEMLSRYRGSALLPPAAQVLERELFARYGWAWEAAVMRAELAALPSNRTQVALDYTLPGTGPRRAAAVLGTHAGRTVLSCGKPEEATDQWQILEMSLS